MNTELKQLIEDAAKLLGYNDSYVLHEMVFNKFDNLLFDPLDPERGDLMKVAEAAELDIDFDAESVFLPTRFSHSQEGFEFRRSNYKSLVLAVLRAASAVLKARGE